MPEKTLKEIKPRQYQQNIYENCKDKNCLVVLPTGIGKTLIALMLAIHRLKKHPTSKVLFLAPTRPLAEQHLNYFKKHLPELFAELTLFTGKVSALKRKKLWQNSEIIFSTPQCISNDIKNNLYNLDEVSLLIEDECHRCLKNYAYTYVVQEYRKQSKNPRVLGLTASPGADKTKIRQIAKNLGIETIEVRTRDSEDVKQYLQKLKIETIKLDFPAELEEIRILLLELYNKKIEELQNRKLLFGRTTKVSLIELQKKIMRMISTGNRHFNILAGASAVAQTIKLGYMIELLETQTLTSLQRYFQDLFEQAKQKKSKAVQQLIKSPVFNKAYILTTELIGKGIENPKLSELKEIIKKEFSDNKIKTKTKRIIVFSQYRETVTKICKTLNEIANINARVFVGQLKKGEGKNATGLNQQEQQEIIRDFSLGKINILCSTSVHPHEYIILKKDDKIVIKKIGEFVDTFIKKDGNGKKAISEQIKGWEALTSDGNKFLFKLITHVHKHRLQNNVKKLKLSSGFDCFVTENHSLFSFNKNKNFIPSIPEKNKFVALALKCPDIEQNNRIDVIKELYENSSKRDIKNLFGSLDGLTQAKMRILKTDFDILSKLEEESSIVRLSKLSKRNYSTIMDCLARLGKKEFIKQQRIQKNYKKISQITNKGRGYLDFLRWFFKNVKYGKGKYKFDLSTTPKNLNGFDDLFKQNININYGKTKYPRFIELNESLARFLGFYVSEGSARKTRYTSDIFLAARDRDMQNMMDESVKNGLGLKTRVNRRGIAIDSQIAYYLINDVFKAGIGAYNKEVPEIIFTAPRNIKWEFLRAYFLGDGYSDENRIVLTTVSRKLVTGIVLLLRILGIKKITLHKQKNIYRVYIHESLPFAKLKGKNKRRGHAYFSLIPNAIISKRAFDKYRNSFLPSSNSVKCRKNGEWNSDICFDYIKEIESIEKPKFVYDLSVQDTENFIGGTGLFCLHNSIGEEGLDIPEVSAVIFYEPIPSAIRQIQRRGRTARLKPGKLIILMNKATRDEAYYWAAFHKEKKMHQALDDIKEELDNNYNKKNEKDLSKQKTLV